MCPESIHEALSYVGMMSELILRLRKYEREGQEEMRTTDVSCTEMEQAGTGRQPGHQRNHKSVRSSQMGWHNLGKGQQHPRCRPL